MGCSEFGWKEYTPDRFLPTWWLSTFLRHQKRRCISINENINSQKRIFYTRIQFTWRLTAQDFVILWFKWLHEASQAATTNRFQPGTKDRKKFIPLSGNKGTAQDQTGQERIMPLGRKNLWFTGHQRAELQLAGSTAPEMGSQWGNSSTWARRTVPRWQQDQ